MMKIECVVLHKLQPEDLTESFCAQHGISSHTADNCNEMLQLWSNRPAGEILLEILWCKRPAGEILSHVAGYWPIGRSTSMGA